MVVVRFVLSTVFAFWGHALLSARIPLVVKLHCVGLQHFGEREGLLAASGSGKSGCSLCFAILQNGVSVPGSRWGGQPVLRWLCPRFALVLQVAVVCV